MIWSEEQVSVLRNCADLGKTFSETARAIGDDCTRNMVAGKAKRLGVTFAANLTEKLSKAGRLSANRMWANPVYRAKQLAERQTRRTHERP